MKQKKREGSKYKDLPIGLCEQRGCRREFYTKKGNPIGQIKCQKENGKWVSSTYGNIRTRKQAIDIVYAAKVADNETKVNLCK